MVTIQHTYLINLGGVNCTKYLPVYIYADPFINLLFYVPDETNKRFQVWSYKFSSTHREALSEANTIFQEQVL